MYIRCPKCGRRGYLPDRLAPEANSLGCRKCGARFSTPHLARLAADRSAVSSKPSAAFVTDGYFSGFDDEPSPRERGAGDSNYELTFSLRDPGSDSGVAWEASPHHVDVEEPSSDEIPVVSAPINASPTPLPWHHRFIETWGLVLIGATLATIAVSLPVMAYGLWRMMHGGTGANPTPSTLIAGFACMIALLVISLPLTLLAAGLTELVRDLHRLRDQLDGGEARGPGIRKDRTPDPRHPTRSIQPPRQVGSER